MHLDPPTADGPSAPWRGAAAGEVACRPHHRPSLRQGRERLPKNVKVDLFVLVALIGQFADAPQLGQHLFVHERLGLGL
jgi:hypothetical protein